MQEKDNIFKSGIRFSTKQYIGLGNVPIGIGAVINGWDIEEKDYRNPSRLPDEVLLCESFRTGTKL